MSYVFHRLRGIGASVSANANAVINIGAQVPQVKATADAAKEELPDCSDARITGGKYPDIDNLVVSCCQDIKKGSGSVKDKVAGIAACTAEGTAKVAGAVAGAAVAGAICVAAGVVTAGASTAASALCASVGAIVGSVVGGWVYHRVSGYSTGQKVAGVIGGAVCGLVSGGAAAAFCSFAAAELVGWISDALAPVMEGIFHPSAAADRERAARRAMHALIDAAEDYRNQADDAMRSLWSQAISAIKALYVQSVGLLSPAYQAQAQKLLGFGANYDGIAKAFVAAGGASTPLIWIIDPNGTTVAQRLRTAKQNGGSGCESTAAGCLHDGYSEVCPFSFNDFYHTMGATMGYGQNREQMTAFEERVLVQMQAIAGGAFSATQDAITTVVTRIVTVTTLLKQQELQAEAQAASEATIYAKASKAAARAQAAAIQATSWSSDKREKALTIAQEQYDIARQARALLTYAAAPGTPVASAATQKKLADAVARAQAANTLAQSNAQRAQLMVGGVAVAAVAGVSYLLLRRS